MRRCYWMHADCTQTIRLWGCAWEERCPSQLQHRSDQQTRPCRKTSWSTPGSTMRVLDRFLWSRHERHSSLDERSPPTAEHCPWEPETAESKPLEKLRKRKHLTSGSIATKSRYILIAWEESHVYQIENERTRMLGSTDPTGSWGYVGEESAY